jgi:hypothetical protein
MKFLDLTGQRFGRLLVVERDENDENDKVVWKCQCDCGTITFVRTSSLREGTTKSCGCLHREYLASSQHTGGRGKSRRIGGAA